MGRLHTLASASLLAALCFAPGTGGARAEGEIFRTEINRADLSGSSTMEVVVARLEIEPGATVPRHSHHGDEHQIVLQGGELTTPDGTVLVFEDGMAADIPAGVVHGGVTVTGDRPVILYTVHIVEKGKPFNEPAE